MHHIYTSESIILLRKSQDSSAYYYVLTKDLGLIGARAQGVRKPESKLKGALQEFSYSTVAFVHGKSGWKITTAIPEKNFYFKTEDVASGRESKKIRAIMSHITDSLIRMIPGEEKSVEVFTIVKSGFDELLKKDVDIQAIELIMLVRMLFVLGLLVKDSVTEPLLGDYSQFDPTLSLYAQSKKTELVSLVNTGFRESQL